VNCPLASSFVSRLIHYLAVLCVVVACATNKSMESEAGRASEEDNDPLRGFNEVAFSLTDSVDRNILRPVAQTYENNTPGPLRIAISNFYANLYYPNTVLNSFLQGKFRTGLADTARLLMNTTIGLGGLIDVGTRIGLEAHNEDFGQTLAIWGAPQGPYLFLPLFGPSSGRHISNLVPWAVLNPLIRIDPHYAIPLAILNLIDNRANLLEETAIRDEAAVDLYLFTREAYLQQRQFLIHDGNLPTDDLSDFFDQ